MEIAHSDHPQRRKGKSWPNKMVRAAAIAKEASAAVKDPELREIAREAVYLHILNAD